jgi:multiple sugar transport system substrate-binding protein
MSRDRADQRIARSGDARLSRRRFLELGAVGVGVVALGSALSACGGQQPQQPAPAAEKAGPGGVSGGGSLKILLSSHFVPAYDQWVDKWAVDWGAKNNVEVSVDHILGAQMGEKVAAEVAANSGHDLIRLVRSGEINLYNKNLVDLTELAKQIGQQHGGWVLPVSEQISTFEGAWKGVPEYFVEFSGQYRKDMFDEMGLKPVDTWDDLLNAGAALKARGNPIGLAINQKCNDANAHWNSLMWCYGASFVAQDGKTVTINSPETKEALRVSVDLYNRAMTNEVLSWDDSANNQGLASGKISWIHNPISSLRTIEKQNAELANKIFISNSPGGPKGRFATGTTNVYGVMSWSQNVPAGKAFIADYFAIYPEAFKASEGYNQPFLLDFRKKPMPILADDPKYAVVQDVHESFRATGHPGSPTPAAGEVESNWIIPLMFAQAVQDGNVDGAVNWASGKIEAIYSKHK